MEQVVQLRTQSPFQVEWFLKSENSFLKSMRRFLMGLFVSEKNAAALLQ